MNKKKTDPLIDHFSKERFFEMPNAIVFDYDNEQAINEMYLSGSYGIGSKSSIAYVGNNFDARHLKASSVYGNIKNHSDGIKKSGVTNDAVKMELTASFIENPREYTNKAISTILNNVSKYYSLTKEEEKIFLAKDNDGFEDREEKIKMLEDKGLLGDKKMVEALKACDFLLKTCAKVETEYGKSYGRTIEKELEEQLEEKCFSKHNAWFDFSKVSDSEKKRIYELFVENQEFIPSDDFNNFSPEEKEKLLKTVASQEDLIFELRKYFKKDIYPPESYIENVYIKEPKNKKNLENYIYSEVKRAKKIARQNSEELTTDELDEIKKFAKKEFIEEYKKEDIRNSYINSQIFLATSSFARQVFSINSLYKNTKKAIEDSSKINKNIRENEDFRFLYEQMSKATKVFSIDGSGAKDYELKKIQKEILFRYNNNSNFKKLIKDAEGFHRDISGESKDFEKLLKGGAMSPSDFKSFSSSVLEESLKRTFEKLHKDEDSNISFTLEEKKVVQKNLIELSRKIVEGKENRITKPFSWNEIVSIYDDFQEKNILEITKNRIKNTRGLDDNTIESLIEKIDNQLKGKTKTSYMPTGELMDDIVDIMNFENITNNKIVQDSIELDEIDSVVQQSFRDDAESAVFKDTAKDVFVKNKKQVESKKKDMSHDARIREVAGHYYSDYANSLMRNSIIGLASKRETLQNFSSCVKGASIMQRNMDTKLSNTTNCLKEFKNSLKKDADEFQREISASLQGVGALNPFAHIAQVVAISRKLMAERIEANMREIADSINGISKEVATAETEIERRARNTILMAKSDGNVNIQSVHNSEKDELSDKLKQEYITREIVDFKEAKTKFSDADPLEILEEYEIPYRNLDKSKLKGEEIDPSAIGSVIGFADGTYTQQELSEKEEQLSNQKEGSELNQDNAEKLSNQENVSNTDAVESKDSLANEDRAGKKEKLSAFNSAMIEDAILKMDKIQKKMAEMSLASGNSYTHKEFLNGASSSKVTAKRLGFTLSSDEEQKELGLESWESKEMRDWMRENDISKELLEKSLAKGHNVIEQEKLALNYQLIIKSLEEMRDKGGADAVRPESKLTDIIKEVKKLFSEDGKKMSKLEKRNTLSSAVNMLHGSANYKRTVETMLSTSSMETEAVKSEQNSEISIFGVADKEKAYILKVHKEQKVLEKKRAILKEKYLSENTHVFPDDVEEYRKRHREITEGKSDEDVEKMVEKEKEGIIEEMFKRRGFEDLSYKADIELLRGTKMVGSETSLSNWSDLLKNSTNFTTYNNGVKDINQEMAQINNSITDYTTESRGDVGRGGFVAPDDNTYAPSK